MRITPSSENPQDDPLALFEAELRPGRPEPAASPLGSSDAPSISHDDRAPLAAPALSLESILHARTPVHWLDAVAILERACAALIDEDGREASAPDASGILIAEDGSVSVIEGSTTDRGSGVNRIGRILHALASGGPMPVPLRLLVTRWIETEEPHSLEEIRQELSHFVRPDSVDSLRALYARGTNQPLPKPAPSARQRPARFLANLERDKEPAAPAPEKNVAVPVQSAAPPPPPPPLPVVAAETAVARAPERSVLTKAPQQPATIASRSKQLRVVVHGLELPPGLKRLNAPNIALAAGLGLAGIVLLSGMAWLMTPSTAPAQNTTSAVAPVPFSQSIELPGSPEAATPAQAGRGARGAAARPAQRAAAPASASASASGATGTAAAPPGIIGNALQPPAARTGSTGAQPSVSVLAARPPVAVSPATAPAPAVARAAGRVYTNADREVDPPIMVYPQVRPGTQMDAVSDLNTMEVVVSEQGLVESVRLLTTPKRMTDMMLLSGAKTWRFRPATVDGDPVRYRMAITWPTTR